MHFLLETPSRRVKFHEADDETSSLAGDTCSVDGSSRDAFAESAGGVPCFELEEDPSFWKENNVQVVIRIRPLNNSEISLQGHKLCVRQNSAQSITWIGHPESRFTFDHVAGEHISQEKLFRVAGVPMVDNCVAGYNSCMFAYGQTGSGKTHTMLGDIEGGTRRHSVNAGMTPRTFEYLFSRIQKEKEARRDEKLQFVCKCSFLEIYNEQILDLLDPSATNLQIREDAKKGVHVENIREFEVSSATDVIQQLVQGAANRKVAATNMNRASSRSHSVFTCVIESKWESQGVTHHRFARLNLVDLAGSERQKSSGAEGERLKEATNINKSLSTLGLVIMNLVSISNKKSLHVPYRDSKLTFLLQDSLGGNAKTIIVANISPSNCCALETLSTLKFAQRAKYIRNNAIVNEDASGDVIAMRLQIQQLKKEVNRLRSLTHGVPGSQDDANVNVCFPGSPGSSFKWDDGQGSFSPLTSDKRSSQRRDYEAALVTAFRREQDKDKALKALLLEKEAAEQLASQRSEEVQGLKMRLRFREEGIKRLEAVASGRLTAETHLLHEKEELVKEIEVLRGQVDRNRQATRFAMENLQLKEELRRLQSFVEEGEREMMNGQITFLQEKLLEALDWKLMHEKESEMIPSLSTSWESSISEENEFLRLQVIQSQRELDALRKNLSCCLEAKEKLERRIDEQTLKHERIEALPIETPIEQSSLTSDDQFELRTMVEAIAAASQREQEAHAMAITLAKENEELREKLRILIDDNNKLIDLYESAVANNTTNKLSDIQSKDTGDSKDNLSSIPPGVQENTNHETDIDMKDVESLEQQLNDMHEENEKLMNLYEQAMKERDEFKRMMHCTEQDKSENKETSRPEKLVEMDTEESFNIASDSEDCFVKVPEANLSMVQNQLEKVQGEILDFVKLTSSYELVKEEGLVLQNILEKFEVRDHDICSKKKELASLRAESSEFQERKAAVDEMFLAGTLGSLPSVQFWEKQEKIARDKVLSCSEFMETKKQEMNQLQLIKSDSDLACFNASRLDAQLRDDLSSLKMKLHEAENRRKESENVLLAIENIASRDASMLKGAAPLFKASELLKSEEERTKLAVEIKQIREKLAVLQNEIIGSRKKSDTLDVEIANLEKVVQSGSAAVEEAVANLYMAVAEKQIALEMSENSSAVWGKLLAEYQELNFFCNLREAEAGFCSEELRSWTKELYSLRAELKSKIKKINEMLSETPHSAEGLLDTAHREVLEALSLLPVRCQ